MILYYLSRKSKCTTAPLFSPIVLYLQSIVGINVPQNTASELHRELSTMMCCDFLIESERVDKRFLLNVNDHVCDVFPLSFKIPQNDSRSNIFGSLFALRFWCLSLLLPSSLAGELVAASWPYMHPLRHCANTGLTVLI